LCPTQRDPNPPCPLTSWRRTSCLRTTFSPHPSLALSSAMSSALTRKPSVCVEVFNSIQFNSIQFNSIIY
jgi:hypothetical protein